MPADYDLLQKKTLLRVDEAKDILRISRRQVYYLCEHGELHSVKISPRGIRIKSESVKALLDAEV